MGRRFIRRGGTIHLIARQIQGRRAVRDADPPASREDGRAGLLLVAKVVHQIAIESERQHGGDAVARILIELRGHVLGRVILQTGAGTARDAHMAVSVDQSGNDVFPAAIHGAGAPHQREIESRNARVINLKRRFLSNPAGAVDDGGVLENNRGPLREEHGGQEEKRNQAHVYSVSIEPRRLCENRD